MIVWCIVNYYVNRIFSSWKDWFSLNLIVNLFPYYLVGNFVKRYKLYNLFTNSFILYLSVTIWMLSSWFTFRYGNYITIFASIIVIVNVCKKIDDSTFGCKKIFYYIGKNTMYIYVFHYFALQTMKTSFFRSILSLYSNIFIDLLLSSLFGLFAILFSMGISCVIKKEPLLMKYVFGRG